MRLGLSEIIDRPGESISYSTVVADEAKDLTGSDVQGQVIYSNLFTVGLGVMFNAKHGKSSVSVCFLLLIA